MIVLGINTARKVGSVCLTRDKELLAELSLQMEDDCLRNLMAMIDYLFKETNLSITRVDLITVVLGPGLWSALRIGVTMAKSLALACNKLVVGVSALDVLAHNFRYTDKMVYPVVGTRKGYVLYAGYDCTDEIPKRVTDYRLAASNTLFDELRTPSVILADDTVRNSGKFTLENKPAITLATPFLTEIRPSFVNEAGLHKFEVSGADDALSLAPLYLQEAEAETKYTLSHNS